MSSKPVASRKPYRAPTLVSHGDAVSRTRGTWFGYVSELWGARFLVTHV